MTHIDIKICGLNDPASVQAAVDAGADMLGFVFFPPSPRHVEPAQAARLAALARGRARVVALTVDADDALLARIAETLGPDLLQLHGRESPERAADVAAAHGLPTMKAFGVGGREDIGIARPYLRHVERVLFDARPPRDATRPGGLGRAFDWRLVAGHGLDRPVMLSGGLHAGTVADAIAVARPDGVDVSSGVESAPGRKDPERIAGFVAAVREAEAAARRREERMTT